MAHLYSQNQDQVVIDLPGHATDRPRDSVDSNLTISSLSENSDAAFELSSDDLPRTLAEQEAEGLLAHQSTQRQQRPEESSSWRHLSWKQRLVPCIFLLLVAFLVGFRPPWFDMRFGFSKDKVSTANSSSTGGMRNIAYYVNWAIYG